MFDDFRQAKENPNGRNNISDNNTFELYVLPVIFSK